MFENYKPMIVNWKPMFELETHEWDLKPVSVDLLWRWHTYFYTNIGLKVKSRVLNSQTKEPMIELLKPLLENHKPMIEIFKHRLEVQT